MAWRFPSFRNIRNIRAKTTLLILVLLAGTTFTAYFITVHNMNRQVTERIVRAAETLGRSVAPTAGFLMSAKDLLGLDTLVFQIKRTNPDIKAIGVLDPERKILAHSDIQERGGFLPEASGEVLGRGRDGTLILKIPAAPGDMLEIESPIVFIDRNLGSVVLSVDWSVLSTARGEARRRIVVIFTVILVLSLLSGTLLSSGLTKPIRELSSGVEQLKQGQVIRTPRVFAQDELGSLTASFNEMSALITSQKDRLAENARDLEEAYVSTIRVVAAALDARDSYTHGHSTRVSELAVDLAREIGWSGPRLEEIEIACLFHDVGKIKIPDSILHKQDRLDPDEWREMQRHTEYGAEILAKAPSLVKFIPAVRHHHEWYDGSGYPDGLSRDGIPPAAAMISLADAYDAMTSDRPYRAAMTREKARRTIREHSGKQFDPDLTSLFLKIEERRFVSSAGGPSTE